MTSSCFRLSLVGLETAGTKLGIEASLCSNGDLESPQPILSLSRGEQETNYGSPTRIENIKNMNTLL